VISEKPAYLMNSAAEGQAVGLKGRVPVRVVGAVKKAKQYMFTVTEQHALFTQDLV